MKTNLNENERRILDVFASVIPKMSEVEKARTLGYAEGIAAAKAAQTKKEEVENRERNQDFQEP